MIMRAIRRRRREGRTDYSKRLSLLKGRMPRVVVRRSNRSITMQICSYEESGDRVLMTVHSKELEKLGWMPKRNTPTAYLTGMLLAKKAGKLNVGECTLDTGLRKPTKASILFAAAKGAADNGLKIRHGIEFDEKRIRGEHIKSYAENSKQGFTLYRKGNVDVSKLDALFEKVSAEIKK